MSEIAGNTSILIASEYLSNVNEGKGLMLGGVAGISPTDVVIIGAGTVGEYACRTSLGLGCNVKVFDSSLTRLRRLHQNTDRNVSTSLIQQTSIRKEIKREEVVKEEEGKRKYGRYSGVGEEYKRQGMGITETQQIIKIHESH